MLNDPKEKITLSDLYRIMKSEKINQILDEETMRNPEGMTASMRISMEAAFKRVEKDDEEALDLFFIISMFPGGVQAKDLDILWTQFRAEAAKAFMTIENK